MNPVLEKLLSDGEKFGLGAAARLKILSILQREDAPSAGIFRLTIAQLDPAENLSPNAVASFKSFLESGGASEKLQSPGEFALPAMKADLKAAAAAASASPQHGSANSAGGSTNNGGGQWKREWEASENLQAEFQTWESYSAYSRAIAANRVEFVSRSPRGIVPAPQSATSKLRAAVAGRRGEDPYQGEWLSSPNLQAEFSTWESYSAFARAEAAGRVHIISLPKNPNL